MTVSAEMNSPKKNIRKKKAVSAKLKAALDVAPVEYVLLSDLTKSPLNVRTIPYAPDSVKRLANSIEALGLLHNLVVHSLPEGQSGVAAGGRRLAALNLLAETGRVNTDYRVQVKRISEELAVEASYAENTEREVMHPAEQIMAFGVLAAQGKTAAQIGDSLGYGSRHVQRMLKLAGLAPELLKMLAQDDLNVEQCQALCLESDPVRQVEVFERVRAEYSSVPPHQIKRAITETEISVSSSRFEFVGREAYEAAGGEVREDLFSQVDGAGTADSVLVERLLLEKLEGIAQEHQQRGGWAWSMGQLAAIGRGESDYLLLQKPETVYTDEEEARLQELTERYDALGSTCEESDELDVAIRSIMEVAGHRAWPDDVKATGGIVASFPYGELTLQYVCRTADLPEDNEEEAQEPACGGYADNVVQTCHSVDPAEGISAPLLMKMSSERTLAVQAALMQQPDKAVALMVWRLCISVFSGSGGQSNPFDLRVDTSHYSLTQNAPSGKTGVAYLALKAEEERLEELLPEGWRTDFSTFFTLDGGLLMSLMAFCTACSVDGVQSRDNGRTSRSKLDALETAIGFHLRDWWQPTRSGYFSGIKHAQIVDSLKEAGMSGAACDAAKMKKGDAAEYAEDRLKNCRWVPGWLQAPQPKSDDMTQAETDTDTDTDTDTPAMAA